LDAGEPIFIYLGRPPADGFLLLLVGHHRCLRLWVLGVARLLQDRGRIAYAEMDLPWP
jgi:hypothetical protein